MVIPFASYKFKFHADLVGYLAEFGKISVEAGEKAIKSQCLKVSYVLIDVTVLDGVGNSYAVCVNANLSFHIGLRSAAHAALKVVCFARKIQIAARLK